MAKNYFSIFNNYKVRDITINTWRSRNQTQIKINTFMPATKHQKYLKRCLPIGEMQLQKSTMHRYLDTSAQPSKQQDKYLQKLEIG